MEIFRWVKALLLGIVLIITFRIFAQAFGWDDLSLVAGYLGALMVVVAGVLSVLGMVRDRNNTFSNRKKRTRT